MSDIKITEHNDTKYTATLGKCKYESDDGIDWTHLGRYSSDTPQLRAAFIRYLQGKQELQHAKIGDWIEVKDSHFHQPLHGKTVQVRLVDRDGDAWVDDVPGGLYEAGGVCVKPIDYTFVPAPEPEPKTYTGPAKDWGAGVYTNNTGVMVFVDVDGDCFGIKDSGLIFSFDRRYHSDFTRIADDPRDAIRAMFAAAKEVK